MKKFFKKTLYILTALSIGLAFFNMFATKTFADLTPNFWFQTSEDVLMTNTPTGLAEADIHVRNCYIGTGTGTPCGGGGGTPAGSDTWVQYNNAGAFGADDGFTRATDQSAFLVGSEFSPGVRTTFEQSATVFGVPISGLAAAYSDNNFTTSFTGLVAGDFTSSGATANSLLVGYQSFASNVAAVMNASYDLGTDTADLRLRTGSTTNRSGINISTAGATKKIEFDFGGSDDYKFPTTQPTVGTVMGYTSAHQLGWVTPTSSIAIGDAIGGGVIADAVLFADASGDLKDSANFTFDSALDVFEVGTSFGTAIKSFDGGGMGNIVEIGDVPGTANKTKFGVYDGTRLIRGVTDFLFQINDSSSPTVYLAFEVNNASTDRSVSIGDSQNLFGRTKILVKDTGQLITLNNSGITKIGDADATVNSTLFTIDDSIQAIKFGYAGDDYTFPIGDGAVGQLLTTNGTGQLSWVDGGMGSFALDVRVATTTTLPGSPVYANGAAGVGATLTRGSNGTLGTIDGISSFTIGDRILVKNQASQLQNGVYEVTTVGSVSVPYELTRTVDADTTAALDDMVVIPSAGTTNKSSSFGQQTQNPTIGTNNIAFSVVASVFIKQQTSGTQVANQIPIYTGTALTLTKGTPDFTFNPSTRVFNIKDTLSNSIFYVNGVGAASSVTLGLDYATTLTLDVGANSIDLTATHVSASLPEYANNAAALVGGLNIGDLYQTTVGGDAFVKRVI